MWLKRRPDKFMELCEGLLIPKKPHLAKKSLKRPGDRENIAEVHVLTLQPGLVLKE